MIKETFRTTNEEPRQGDNPWDTLAESPWANKKDGTSEALGEKRTPVEPTYIGKLRKIAARVERIPENAMLDSMLLKGPAAFMDLFRVEAGSGRSDELIVSMLDEQIKNEYIRRYDLPAEATWEEIYDADSDAFYDDCERANLSLSEESSNYIGKAPEEYRKILIKRYGLSKDETLDVAKRIMINQCTIMERRIEDGSSLGYLRDYMMDERPMASSRGVARLDDSLPGDTRSNVGVPADEDATRSLGRWNPFNIFGNKNK